MNNRRPGGDSGLQQQVRRPIARGRARQVCVNNPDGFPTDFCHPGRGRGVNNRRLLAWPERGSLNQTSAAPHFTGQKQEHDQKDEGQNEKHNDRQRNQKHVKNPEQKIEKTNCFVNKVCQFCGKRIIGREDEKILNHKLYHKICSVEDVIKAFSDRVGTKHVLWMTLPVQPLCGSKDLDKKAKKEFRDSKITELLNNASALRNSNSGFLLIYLEGLDPNDNCTGAFDEFADVKLRGLINDGSLFDDVFKKKQLSEYPGLETFTDILVLYVESADFLITSDFKTKEALDDCIVDISEPALLKFLQKKRKTEKKFYEITCQNAEDVCRFQESRHIQMKAYFQPNMCDDEIALHIFDKLRAAEYISAFSKNVNGGSYMVGIVEETNSRGEYQRKVLSVKSVAIDDCEVFAEHIRRLVFSRCLVCDYEGIEMPDEDLVKINFIPTVDNTGYVVHISVSSVNGVVFYDKEGPVAHKIDLANPERRSITRYSRKDWFTVFSGRYSL